MGDNLIINLSIVSVEMTRQPVVSSNLASVDYNPKTRTLEIEFKSGGVYAYSNVPESVYSGLMSAGSKGKYFASVIKDVYPYVKVG